jgi:probable HAF family extracellular repeat protein
MKKPKIIRLTLALAALVAVTIAFGQTTQPAVRVPQAPPPLRYNVIDLGVYVNPGFWIGANAITDSGHIVGLRNFGADIHAAYWPDSQSPAVDLGTPPGTAGSVAGGINPRGEIVGNTAPFLPVYWASNQSAPVELPGVPEGFLGGAASINAVGQIVGSFNGPDEAFPVFWPDSNAAPIYLPVFNEFPLSVAASINAAGNILGDAINADFTELHAVFWASSTSAPVALAAPGGEFINTDFNFLGLSSQGLNNAGNMVGVAFSADLSELRAVFWASSASPAVILSTTAEFPNGNAEGISDKGQIVGEAFNSDFSDFHAFMWPSSASPGIDLNTVIPSGSGGELVVARDINNRGEIVGTGILNGAQHGYALIPVHGRMAPRP